MSKHREPAVKSAPSMGNVAQPQPRHDSQPAEWYAKAEQLRVERESPPKNHAKLAASSFTPPDRKEVAMDFAEIGRHLGCTPQHAQHIFNQGMRKLARMSKGQPMQELHSTYQLKRWLRDQATVIE